MDENVFFLFYIECEITIVLKQPIYYIISRFLAKKKDALLLLFE